MAVLLLQPPLQGRWPTARWDGGVDAAVGIRRDPYENPNVYRSTPQAQPSLRRPPLKGSRLNTFRPGVT